MIKMSSVEPPKTTSQAKEKLSDENEKIKTCMVKKEEKMRFFNYLDFCLVINSHDDDDPIFFQLLILRITEDDNYKALNG
jgi:hypothetical protein